MAPTNTKLCEDCGKVFATNYRLNRHRTGAHSQTRVVCPVCDKPYRRREDLNRHVDTVHRDIRREYPCEACGKVFTQGGSRSAHQQFHCRSLRQQLGARDPPSGVTWPQPGGALEPRLGPSTDVELPPQPGPSHVDETITVNRLEANPPEPRRMDVDGAVTAIRLDANPLFRRVETAFRNRLHTFSLRELPSRSQTLPEFLNEVSTATARLLDEALADQRPFSLKTNLFVECEFSNVAGETCVRAFKTRNIVVTPEGVGTERLFEDMARKLVLEMETCQMVGSGWAFARVLDLQVRVNRYVPLRGSHYIPLPEDIERTKSTVNVCDRDDRCFVYAILAPDVPANPHRPTSYTEAIRARWNFDGLTFPVPVRDVAVFERNNPGISVNVYGLEPAFDGAHNRRQHIVFPLKVCDVEQQEHRDLLFVTSEDGGSSHYVCIVNLERLVRSQLTRRHGAVKMCRRCLSSFPVADRNKLGLTAEQRLEEHRRYCVDHAPLRTELASKTKISFSRAERTTELRFVAYADFECQLQPVEEEDAAGGPSTVRRHIHVPYAYCLYVHDKYDRYAPKMRHYVGEDAAKDFMRVIKETIYRIGDILFADRQMRPILDAAERAAFDAADVCYLCGNGFSDEDPKVADHYHPPPHHYRGAAHRSCNLFFREQDCVNCYFHNLSNYDGHFVVRELGVDSGDVSVVANTEERYILFEKRFRYQDAPRRTLKVRFLDSLRFLPSSLARLVEITPPDQLKETRKWFPDPREFDLVRRKGVFPYEHVTSMQALDEPGLPPIEEFHSSLTGETVSEEDYRHAHNVWDAFGCRTLGEYALLYLKTDVLLLADVFQNFRNASREHYDLDPAHYATLPSFAWEAMLHKTGVVLDTVRDVDMYLFFEKGIRGGITQCVTRHSVANNSHHREPNDDDGQRPPNHILYLDANNLYGWAMTECLPTGGFEWLSEEELANQEYLRASDDHHTGYVLEVDLEYPRDPNLHDRHRDLPFCPETATPPRGKHAKLLTTLTDKTRYVVHYRVLKQALANGLRLVRVHRALSFRQSRWLQRYIRLNTDLRKTAKNDFERDLFKLMNNAVFGKSMENARRYIDVRLVTDPRKFERLVARPSFLDRTRYTEDLALVHLRKVKIVLDKPIYVGMCVLEISKWLMYDFHTRMQTRHPGIRLLYTDTDSLIYAVNAWDFFVCMRQHLDDFDTSEYPEDHPCYDPRNAKVVGKFKDETKGRIIAEFVGLMPKLYAFRYADQTVVKRAKGVSRGVVKHSLGFDDYKRCLLEHVDKYTTNTRIRSERHVVVTEEVTKLSLSSNDNKRYVLPDDGINTLPWGHYLVPPPPPPPLQPEDDED